jgi:hypothetical protein
MATDGKGSYREAMLSTWGQVPEYRGRGRPPTHKQPGPDWHYLQVIKERSGSRLLAVHTHVVYGDPEEVRALLGEHTAYVERTHLTSRQMNARLVRKSLSSSRATALVASSFQLGRLDLQFDAPCQDATGEAVGLLWATSLASTDSSHGRRTHRSHLDRERAVDDRRSSLRYQHNIGRLPEDPTHPNVLHLSVPYLNAKSGMVIHLITTENVDSSCAVKVHGVGIRTRPARSPSFALAIVGMATGVLFLVVGIVLLILDTQSHHIPTPPPSPQAWVGFIFVFTGLAVYVVVGGVTIANILENIGQRISQGWDWKVPKASKK